MEGKTKSKVGAPEGNKNAEKWDFEKADKLFDDCIKTSEGEDYDFIGEVAKANKVTRHQLKNIADKFPVLHDKFETMKSNCEVNCFANGKKKKINTAMAIMNLKSNHGWTDRIDNTTQGDKLPSTTTVVHYEELSDALIEELAKKSQAWKE